MASRSLSSIAELQPSLPALLRAGYETTQDLSSSTPETLARELNISLPASQSILSLSQKPTNRASAASGTRSVASMVSVSNKFSTRCSPVDNLLSGGLSRGHILEISGPPGTPKESLAIQIVQSFVEANEQVLFVDSQNMTSPATLDRILKRSNPASNYLKLVSHVHVHTLPELLMLMNNLPSILKSHPKTTLLVLNSISFPFQSPSSLTVSAKKALLESVKQALTKACASTNLTVVTTSQLSTKLLNADGSPGTFDTGSQAVMIPQLGSGYLPSGRTHRILIVPESRQTGFVRLISSPTHQTGQPLRQEAYTMDGKFMS